MRPKIKKKITHEDLELSENIDFKKKLYDCLDDIWTNHKIYILRRGELEKYLTEEGKKVPGSKETKLLNIKEQIEQGRKIEEYFLIDEFRDFFNVALRSFIPTVTPLTTTVEILATEATSDANL
ncbi:hypothetical protein MUN82_19910 [Hymenobacter aerilatus]|uniref:Uncharacterized protein n=1 Tax=Hymenobacter aerilatus TaxID=2932251 RepID=A0A8T9SYB3_9BACT|nr:hypothetical protein [Hymenobacter aerilatus]UOR05190.1 hypothetical protein MUN82_19910 [Hymenobacter aerilatus]